MELMLIEPATAVWGYVQNFGCREEEVPVIYNFLDCAD
jgi:hypothetical protein